MRTIKFKGWNGKRMTREYTLYEMLSTQLENNGLKENWMQFTGLLDKNGKEIYESDILDIDGMVVPVKWYNGAFVVEFFRIPTKSYLSVFDETDISIVGNIYENPNLLK